MLIHANTKRRKKNYHYKNWIRFMLHEIEIYLEIQILIIYLEFVINQAASILEQKLLSSKYLRAYEISIKVFAR